MPVQALTDLLSVNGAVSATSLTTTSTVTSNDNGVWSRGRGNSGVYWETRPDATKWFAWYGPNATTASLYYYNGTVGGIVANIGSDGSITTLLGTVAFTGHTHAYLPLSGGTLTGLLTLQPGAAAVALAIRRSGESFDRVQLWESGLDCGDGTSSPDATELRWTSGTFDVLLSGSTKLNVSASAVSAYTPIYSNGTNAALWFKIRTDQSKTWGFYSQVTDGPAYLYFYNGATGSNLFSFFQNGQLTATTFQSTQATGTAPLIVASTTLVTNLNADLWDGSQLNSHTASMRSNCVVTGGGIVTVSASNELKWSSRMVVIANGRGAHFSTTGFFDIFTPAAGTVIAGVGGAAFQTATAGGIPLTDGGLNWVSLYYILPIGSNNLPVPTYFRLVSYSEDVTIPEHWVCIARRNPESGSVHLANGLILKAGESFDLNLYSSANPPQAGEDLSPYYINTSSTAQTKTGDLTVNRLGSSVATGTAPFVVSSTTRVPNLNADLFRDLTWETQLSAGRAAFGGAVWDPVDARWEHTEAAGKYAFTLKHNDGQGVSAGNGGALTLYMGDVASTGVGSAAISGSVKYFVFDKNGEFLATTLRSTAATGTAPLTIASTTQVTNLNAEMWAGFKAYTSFACLKANTLMTGGGTITFSAAGELRWTERFLVLAGGYGSHFSTVGYFDINMPADATVITGVGGASNQTVVAGGIPLTSGASTWCALYYILPAGSANTTVNANYRLVGYTSAIQIPDTWVPIAVRNATSTSVRLGNGLRIKPGQTVSETNTPWTDANDGSASGLDADLLDGQHGSYYQNASNLNAGTVGGPRLALSNPLDVSGAVMAIGGIYWGGSSYVHDKTTGYGFAFRHGDGNGAPAGSGGAFQIHLGQTASTGVGSAAGTTTIFFFDKDGEFKAQRLTSTVAIGVAPLTVTSTTLVANLNADYLDGQHGAYFLNTSSGAQAKAGTLQVTGLGIGMAPVNALDVAGTVAISSAIPRQYWNETDAAVDNKNWDLAVEAAHMYFRVVNDARTVTAPWLSVTRSGTTVTEVRFDCTSLKVGLVEIASQDWVSAGHLRLDAGNSMTSSSLVTNLNADYLDGMHASAFAAATHVHPNISIIVTNSSITGGGSLATNLTLALSGDSANPGNSRYYGTDGAGTKGWFALPAGGTGTVTSVGLTGPAEYSYGAAISTNGNLNFAWQNQTAGKVLAAPASATGGPSFRVLVASDIPTISQSQVTNLATDLADKLSKASGGTVSGSTTFGGSLSIIGTHTIKAAAGGTAGLYFACWLSDPSTSGQSLQHRTAAQVRSDIGAGTGSGTVTQVALTAPSFMTAGGTPITGSGTLSLTWSSQLANLVLASPSGASGVPVFRLLGSADITANTFAPYAHSHGLMNNAGFISGAVGGQPMVTGASGAIGVGSFGTTAGSVAEGNHTHSAYALVSHTHGQITNAGAIGSTTNLPIITTASGVLNVGSFGTAANTFCQGNDPRLAGANFPTTPDGYYIYRVSGSGATKSWVALPAQNGNYVLVISGGVASWQQLVGTTTRVEVGTI